MSPTRVFLAGLAVLTGLVTVYLATSDVHYTDRNCGSALLGTDPNKLSMSTGNPEEDDFTQQSLIDNCDQLVLERRFMAVLAAGSCVACVLVGRRLRSAAED